MSDVVIQNVRFDERGLIPAVVQDAATNEIIALHYMDNRSWGRTLKTGQARFPGGALSGAANSRLLDVRINADGASLTVLIERERTGEQARKSMSLTSEPGESMKPPHEVSLVDVAAMEFGLALNQLITLITERKEKRPEGSYTTYLFNSGLDKILKKIAEESGEVIIAAKNKNPREIVSELADLFYHLLVLMVERDVKLGDVHAELTRRAAANPPKSAG